MSNFSESRRNRFPDGGRNPVCQALKYLPSMYLRQKDLRAYSPPLVFEGTIDFLQFRFRKNVLL